MSAQRVELQLVAEEARSSAAVLLRPQPVGSSITEPPILTFLCSAVIRPDGAVFTASHCVDSSTEVIVGYGSPDLCEPNEWANELSEVLTSDEETDVAEIGRELRATGDARIATNTFVVPEAVVALGWQQSGRDEPLGCELQTVFLSDCAPAGPQYRCAFAADNRVCSGLSGAGVWGSRGTLVAVVSSSLGCSDGYAFVGPIG